MSLSRLIFRSLVCNAFMKHDYDRDHVTMALDKVYDSRLNPLQFDLGKQDIPSIVVYTDEDEKQLQNRSTNSGPYTRHVDLRIELAIGSFEKVTYEVDGRTQQGIAQALPTTDPEMEAKLDLFEAQVLWAFKDYVDRPATKAVNAFVVALEHMTSSPHRDETGNNRLAMRRLMYRCRINDDCPPSYMMGDVAQLPKKKILKEDDFPVGGWLQQMLVALQDQPGVQNVISALGGDMSRAEILPLLKRIGVKVDCIMPASPTLLAQLNQTRGPDGRVEVQALWELPE